jgi:prolyl oligopeptidase
MQEQVPDSTVYLRIEQRAGHGQGNALRKTIDRNCDTLAFLCDKLGGPIKELPKLDRV